MKKVLLMIIVFMFSMNLYSVEKDVSVKIESIQKSIFNSSNNDVILFYSIYNSSLQNVLTGKSKKIDKNEFIKKINMLKIDSDNKISKICKENLKKINTSVLKTDIKELKGIILGFQFYNIEAKKEVISKTYELFKQKISDIDCLNNREFNIELLNIITDKIFTKDFIINEVKHISYEFINIFYENHNNYDKNFTAFDIVWISDFGKNIIITMNDEWHIKQLYERIKEGVQINIKNAKTATELIKYIGLIK